MPTLFLLIHFVQLAKESAQELSFQARISWYGGQVRLLDAMIRLLSAIAARL